MGLGLIKEERGKGGVPAGVVGWVSTNVAE
jgi:hypothetical protein